MHATYGQNYDSAAALIERLPHDSPDYRYWRACLVQMLIYDSGNSALLDSFYRLTDAAVQCCREAARRNPKDPMPSFYLGIAELNRANLQSWQQRKLAAFGTLLKVTPNLSRARRLEPGMTDALFGLGVVEYFKSTANRYVLGLRLFGSRRRAYDLLWQVERNGTLLRPTAEFMLGFMMKEDRDYEGAVASCLRMLEEYPGSRSARRLLRDVYLDMGEYEKALGIGHGLEQDIYATWPRNFYGMNENWLKLAVTYERAGDRRWADYYADLIISYEPWQCQVPWLPNYVREAKALKRRLAR
jgi:hypothetical protein